MRVQPANIAVIGIDLGKNSCSLAALDGNGAVVKRRSAGYEIPERLHEEISMGGKPSPRPPHLKALILPHDALT